MRHVRISSILAIIAVVMMVSFTTVALAQQAGQSFEAEAQPGQSLSPQPQPTPSPTPQPQPAPGPAPRPGQSFEAEAQAGQIVGGQPQPGPGPAPQPLQSPPAGSQPPPAGSQPPPAGSQPPQTPPPTNEFRDSGLIVEKIAYASDGPPQRPEASASGFEFIAIEVDGTSCNSPVPGGDRVTAVEIDIYPDLKSYSSYQFIAGTANGLLISTYYCLYETDTVNSEGRIFRPFDPVYTTGYLFFSGPYPGYTSRFQVVNNEVP